MLLCVCLDSGPRVPCLLDNHANWEQFPVAVLLGPSALRVVKCLIIPHCDCFNIHALVRETQHSFAIKYTNKPERQHFT